MFYDKYVALCERAGKTPRTVAMEMGFGNSAATYWQRGSMPRRTTLKKVAEYFDVPVAFFEDEAIAREILGADQTEEPKKPVISDARRDRLKQMIDMAASEEELRRLEQAVLAVLFAPPGE